MRKSQLFFILGIYLVLILLAGCGSRTTDATRAAPAQISTTVLTPTIRTDTVTLQVSAKFYQVKDTITVLLSNQSSQTIYFSDHLTNCTVILLERLKPQPLQPLASENGQAGVNPCRLGIATREHSLGVGQSLVVKLLAPSNGWLSGLYLATLSYRTSFTAGTSKTIYSLAFQVGSDGTAEP